VTLQVLKFITRQNNCESTQHNVLNNYAFLLSALGLAKAKEALINDRTIDGTVSDGKLSESVALSLADRTSK
jgi:hypothetical protein